MSSVLQNEEEPYNSSSDEDYDPEKDTDFNQQDEIDDAEEDEDTEGCSELAENDKAVIKESEKPISSGSTDVDAIFAALTGQSAPLSKNDTSACSSSKTEELTISNQSACIEANETSKIDTKKSASVATTSDSVASGKKRVGLLDAAKTLSKRSKMSVLERSDRDWKNFTAQHNLKEDLESHNRGKGGYLNKLEFLNRTDNRQFEKERALRATARKDPGI